MKKILFYTPDIDSSNVNFGLLFLRLFAGFSLAFAHGLGKLPVSEEFVENVEINLGFPLPLVFAWLGVLSEFLGGILVGLGLLTRPAALFAFLTMMTAAFNAHAGDPFASKEKALLFGVIMLFILFTGPGSYSIDARINRAMNL